MADDNPMSGVDVKLSLGEATLEAMLGIHTELKSMRSDLARILDLQFKYQEQGPIYVPIGGSATSPSSGNFTIDLGGPAPLRRWLVRAIVAGGSLWSSTVNGTGVLYQNAINQAGSEPSLANVEDEYATLPKAAFYSNEQIMVRHPNRLFLFVGGTPSAATLYTVGGLAMDLPDLPAKFTV